ncbi:RES family NAD+ phosphorylase [Clavibacter seminis]|uniref:RES domain-containing protein n=1 Tax=Clavibacter michiganensis TaxID=28447 RepID=A0A399NY99_9MICO|nr:hypothetical protein DZF96_00285 [Clavibacter michiganensis]
MSDQLDEDLVERLNELTPRIVSGTYYRYSSARREPLSGAGARAFGGRWNPRGLFPAIYLAEPKESCAGEARRAAEALGTSAEVMLEAPFMLHTIEVNEVSVLNLTTDEALEHVGLSREDIADNDHTACRAVGHAAWFLGFQGVLAPSASEVGFVLAAFEGRLDMRHLRVDQSEPFTPALYSTLAPALW